jgi:glycosyltransferase involved in cell wall biosynthesis
MIYFDVTKTAKARHRSGLMRVSERLRDELGEEVAPVIWREGWRALKGRTPLLLQAEDWVLTPELFSEAERPGFRAMLRERSCRLAAIFHDAIPLRHPQITWPQSVARHPDYMKMLAGFDRVFAVSKASAAELTDFWKWQGAEAKAQVVPIELGADLKGVERVRGGAAERKAGPPVLLSVGILEPRKNQALLLDVAETLLKERVEFRLELVGRVNPHFGSGLEKRARGLAKTYPQIRYQNAAGDKEVLALARGARASLFPTLAEGCGLPLLESLWLGVPCVCSDLPVLRENGEAGGCEFVEVNDRAAWTTALRRVIGDSKYIAGLAAAAGGRDLPTWKKTAETLLLSLRSG